MDYEDRNNLFKANRKLKCSNYFTLSSKYKNIRTEYYFFYHLKLLICYETIVINLYDN